jgi:inner membrane transporter RhtA
MALTAMVSVQLGAALSTHLFSALSPAGTVWLRMTFAAVILLAVTRPTPWTLPRPVLASTVALGVVTGLMMMLFMEAVARIPLGTVVAIEFLGPVTVAALTSHRRTALVWPALALAGVVALTHPWAGHLDPGGIAFALGAATGWGSYILLTERVGAQVEGLTGLALSLTVAALVATPFGVARAVGGLTPLLLAAGAGLAVIVPLLPFVLEMQALRRMPLAAFGTLMAVEPAIATVIGLVVLTQTPGPLQVVGVAAVVAAGVGAQRAHDGAAVPAAVDVR